MNTTYRRPADRSTARRYADTAARAVWDGRGVGDGRDTATRAYVAARERGETPALALARARTERVAARVLTPADTTGRELDAYGRGRARADRRDQLASA